MRITKIFVAGWLVLPLFLLSCGRREALPAPKISVRLLTTVTGTGRWELAAEQGLGRIAAELDADVARLRVGDAAERRRSMDEQGREGVDLVFCVGPGFDKVVYSVAASSPGTAFVLLPGSAHAPNVGGILFLPEEAGYLAGAAAEAIASSDRVGLLKGSGRPWLDRLEQGFVAGFRARRSGVVVETSDGVEGVRRLIAAGVDVALYASDLVDERVIAAARDSGLVLVATDPELMAAAPDLVVAAVEVDVAEAMLRVARDVHDGTFAGRIFAFDLGSGVLDVVANEAWEPAALESVRDAIEHARSEITAGFVEIEELGF
ncbi:MAG: BMP family protein [Thermoanaerobaculales bacterium]